jgi:Tol biopolymer transport system component
VLAGVGWRWNVDGTKDVASIGVHTATLRFDAAGNIIGLDAPPAFLVPVGTFEDPLVGEGSFPDISGQVSFSPDMTKLVADHNHLTERRGLRIIDVSTGTETPLVSDRAFDPRWSPDGTKIAFIAQVFYESIDVVAIDGSGRIPAFNPPWDERLGSPVWSPDSLSLVFYVDDEWGQPPLILPSMDIYRAPAVGGGAVNLTRDVGGRVSVTAWR